MIQSDSVFKNARERIRQCEDVIVALTFYMESQPDSPSAVEEVLEDRNYVKNISGTLKKILRLVEASSGQMNLTSFVVSELNMFVLSSKKSLDVLESELELFEITHMDKRDQLKSWLKMLLVFQEQKLFSFIITSNSQGKPKGKLLEIP